MRLQDFDYALPEELIAQAPAPARRAARMLVHDATDGGVEHVGVADLPRFLRPGDLLVVNNTRVRRARVAARRPGGGAAECLLVERAPSRESRWLALVKPASRLRPSMVLELPGDGQAIAIERERGPDGEVGPGWWVELRLPQGVDEEGWLEEHGELPLPPYVERPEGNTPEDLERYQTVYARHLGAVAAPTAGLHLDQELLAELEGMGVERVDVTLHVGPGTFRPVDVDDPREHRMHAERYELPVCTAEAVERTRARGGRVVAVGTTSVRTLESCHLGGGRVRASSGSTDLFLHPGVELNVVDAILTNFHLPRSTLLMLVAAYIGRERTLELYRDAVERRYRFFSYGDAMLLVSPRHARP